MGTITFSRILNSKELKMLLLAYPRYNRRSVPALSMAVGFALFLPAIYFPVFLVPQKSMRVSKGKTLIFQLRMHNLLLNFIHRLQARDTRCYLPKVRKQIRTCLKHGGGVSDIFASNSYSRGPRTLEIKPIKQKKANIKDEAN